MIRQDLILRHPLRRFGFGGEDILDEGGFGAVLARAGVGKTALLVQLALNAMIRGRRVLHVSMNEPVGKVGLWYEEMYSRLAAAHTPAQKKTLWEEILPLRFIMTFKVEGFSVPRFQERLNDLVVPGIFKPEVLLIDGLQFELTPRTDLEELKKLARAHNLRVWFTVHIHRHQEMGRAGIPIPLVPFENLFEFALLLATEEKRIGIRVLKTPIAGGEIPSLTLDPSSMLVMDEAC
ncbi:MAG: AAA family ATPase [Syntrophales bacterium]|nr:AAA family ATPase [Syntrophales bacterium]